MVEVKIKIALGLIAILILAAPIAIAQEVPPHVVISEVQIATDEFVELYNPTNSAIDMTGWYCCYFSSGRNWNKSYRDKTFPPGAIIPAHGFYLIATTSGDFPTADWNLEYATHFLKDTAGSVGIFPWDPDTKTAEEAKTGKIDAVGWGSVTYVYETATASTPGSGESIEREPLKVGYAPCQDTDDNSVDFVVQDIPTPKNSSSLEMEPAPVEIFDADGDFKGGSVRIQDAVDAASDGYTIRVNDGTYNENVDVDKPLTICSEHGAAVTTVLASDSDDNVFAVTVDHVTISGFNVAGATQKAGIYLYNADYCNIANNMVSNNKIGIHLQIESQHNTITNNNVSDNEDGISLHDSKNNHIYNNYFVNANNAIDDNNNIWNITKIGGTNIIGGSWLGGNYWSNYAGADTDDDGLGDSLLPYNSGGNIQYGGDSLPLVPVGSVPILSIVKSGELDALPPGGTLNYTIIVGNTGNATATNVNVTETYDANVTFESAVPAPSHGNDTWKFDTLNVSETKWINVSVTVNASTANGTVLHNLVNVSCEEEVADYDIENTTVFSDAVHITSFAPPSPVNDTVCNWRTFNVTVDQTVNVSWYLNGSLLFTNESVRDVSCRLHADAAGVHNVTAKASNENGSDSHSWIWNVKQPGISVTKVGNVTEGVPPTNVNFTINVTNTGDCTLNPVKVVDTLPAGMSYVATGTSPAPSSVHGNTITWNNVGPLNPGAYTMISLIAHIDTSAEDTLTNLVNATGKPPAGDNATDSATADVTVLELDIVVISEVFYDESGTKDINEFCELYNPTDSDIDIGNWTLKAFDQTGVLKTNTTFPDDAIITAHKYYLIGEKAPLNSSDWGGAAISPDCLRGGSDWQNGPDDYLRLENSRGNYIDGVRWGHKDGNNPPAIPDVPDNNTAPDVTAGKSIERKPLDGGYAPCQDTDNNALDFVVQDTPTPKNSSSLETGISVTKVGDVTEAKPSTLVNFNITVNNTGKCRLKHVLVEDTLPAGMTYNSSYPLADSTNGAITWDDVGPLAVNASTTIKLVAQIEEDAEGVLKNTVDVTGRPVIGTNVYASATAQVSVIRLAIEKSCKSTTSLGKTVTYTIKYSNPGEVDLTNVVITENYPDDLTFKSAVPAPDPGTNNKWTIGTLPADESGKITIKMKVPASMSDLSYTESGSVSGEGIVMISKELSTKVEPFDLENIVTISGSYGATNVSATATAITTVSVSGSSLEITEHGSGTYESEEELSVSPEKMGIKFDKTTNAEYRPTTFNCSDGFVMEVPSKWSQDICIKNYVKKSAIHKTITEATY
ncbi:MAG: NosD domain-containing protein, partial [Halobacteriota archaeon]